MTGKRIGFALCGSFCNFRAALDAMRRLAAEGCELLPILSQNAASTDTRFGRAEDFLREAEAVAGRPAIRTIAGAEPIGPKAMCDLLFVCPCTGNTLAKLAAGISDGPVTMAVKSHLRGGKPVLLALATNDALAAAAKNLGELLNRKHYYFLPLLQDDPVGKPTSLVADFRLAEAAVDAALAGRQLLPLFRS